jgi:hypothetical protein
MIKKSIFILLILSYLFSFSQRLKFPEQRDFSWPDHNMKFLTVPDSLAGESLIILKDEFTFRNGFLTRRLALKAMNSDGISKISDFQLPDDIDLTNFSNEYRQGRFKDQKIPFYYTYDIQYFAARIIRSQKGFFDLDPSCKKGEVFWIKTDGSHIKQETFNFEITDIQIGDIVEITYKVEIKNARVFLSLNTIYPRLMLNVITDLPMGYHNLRSIDTAQFRTTKRIGKNFSCQFFYLNAIRYPDNSGGLRALPYLVMNEWRSKWISVVDSVSRRKYNTKEQNALRAFADRFVREASDSSGNKVVAQMIDNINQLEFVSAEKMYFSAESQYALTAVEHLNKGRLEEQFELKTYDGLLEEKKIFFLYAIIGDKRKSEVKEGFYSNTVNRQTVFAIPEGKSLVFYKIRKDALKYLPNELPFYLEGTMCALIPQNTHFSSIKTSITNKMLFTKTPGSSFNENLRSEIVKCNISIDSSKIRLAIKENLSGQFSTLLRPYYNNEYIDSTVSGKYFKKCTEKPFAKDITIKQISSAKTFPFKHTFGGEETIFLQKNSEISLLNWFSFVFSKKEIGSKPNHDYYMDFQFTDSYNYLFEFDKPCEIINSSSFTKKIINEYFELSSNLTKQESNKFLLSIIVKVKQDIIPKKDADKFMDFITALEDLNNLKLNYKIL